MTNVLARTRQDDAIARAYASGVSLKALAREYDVTVGVIRCAAKRGGYVSKPSSFTPRVVAEMTRLYHAGASWPEIASVADVSPCSARNKLAAEGVHKRRVPFAWTRKMQALALRLDRHGLTHKEIALRVGVERQRVTALLTQLGRHTPAQPKLTREENLCARRMIERGMFLGEVASAMRIDTRMIKCAARRDGWWDTLYPDPSMRSGMRKRMLRRLREGQITSVEHKTYMSRVRMLTRESLRQFGHIVDPHGLRSRNHHVDHRLSITDGSIHRIDPSLVAHPANLCVLSARENYSKGGRSSVGPQRLREEARAFEERYGKFAPHPLVRVAAMSEAIG